MSILDKLKKVISPPDEVKELRAKIKESPNNPSLHQRLAEKLVKRGDYSEAIQEYYTAASLFDNGGFGLKAIAVLKQCLKIDPSNLETVKLLIKYQSENGLPGDAVTEFKNVIGKSEMFPGDREREEFIEYVLRVLGDHPDIHAVLIKGNIEKGNFIGILSSIEKSVPHIKSRRELNLLKAVLDEYKGDEELVKELQVAFGLALISRGFREDGTAILERVREEFPFDEEEREAYEALSEYMEDRDVEPDLPLDLKEVATFIREKREEERKKAEYELSEKEGARVEEEKEVEGPEDIDSVLVKLREKVEEEIGEEDLNARYNLGIAFKEMGLYEEAVQEFVVSRKDDALYFPSSLMLVDCYEAMEDYEKALGLVEELLGQESRERKVEFELMYKKGIFLEKLGRDEEAKGVFLQIYEQDSEYKDVAVRVQSD